MPLEEFVSLTGEKYISLNTFRKNGDRVPTAVWFATDGDALVVTTMSDSGKVKRARNNSRVQFSACSRSGRVNDDAVVHDGEVEVIAAHDDRFEGYLSQLRTKYGLLFRIMFGSPSRPRGDAARRVILRITPTASTTK